MNVLFFTYDFPFPTNSGGKTRAYNLLKFAKKNARITLFSFVRDRFNSSQEEGLKKIGIDDIIIVPRRSVIDMRSLPSLVSGKSIFHGLYFDKGIEKKLLETIEDRKIDIVHFESFYTGYYLSTKLREMGIKQVFGTENIEYLLYEGYAEYHASYPLRVFFKRQARKIKKEEEHFYQLADCVLTVTNEEKKHVIRSGHENVIVIENGVDVSIFKSKKNHPANTLLFIGNFSYYPNVDAMRWFLREVFPLLSEDLRLLVVGRRSGDISFLKHARVTTREFVENTEELFSSGTVLIAPIRIGGGTNFKIIEAMAARLPVVALSDRISSFDFENGREFLVGENAGEFADHIKHILGDTALRKKITENAYRAVSKEYDWTKIGDKLYKTWQSLLYEKN
ncbi:MAG: glycosyltransferase family 4 protein [bacterium]|nr:glycosyltransferase family 4 protein [bacterium]